MIEYSRLHPALVHFPIALLTIAGLVGLVYLIIPLRSEWKLVTWWAMIGGWIGTVVAIGSGMIAQAGLPPEAPYRFLLNRHIGAGFATLVLYGFILYRGWLFATPRARRRRSTTTADDLFDDPHARVWLAALLIVGILLIVITGWSGGELVFGWGVNVG